MLDIMNRHDGWSLIIALVGNGQEINTGEAGLSEWGRALTNRFRNWKVCISGALATNNIGDGDCLFETAPEGLQVTEAPFLHLGVSIRSYKAQAVSDFVAYLLSCNMDAANRCLVDCSEYPIVLTRDLEIDPHKYYPPDVYREPLTKLADPQEVDLLYMAKVMGFDLSKLIK